jgi:hypothetical protein
MMGEEVVDMKKKGDIVNITDNDPGLPEINMTTIDLGLQRLVIDILQGKGGIDQKNDGPNPRTISPNTVLDLEKNTGPDTLLGKGIYKENLDIHPKKKEDLLGQRDMKLLLIQKDMNERVLVKEST